MNGYHVFDGQKWLAEDEKTWTGDYRSSASFNDPKLAQDIGEREAGETRTIYVMGRRRNARSTNSKAGSEGREP